MPLGFIASTLSTATFKDANARRCHVTGKPAHVLCTSRMRVGRPVFTDASREMTATSGTWVQDLQGITRPPRGRPRV
jgi:hypothetical protein